MEPNYGYKHTRGFIVFLIIIFCGWVIVAHSQTSYTENLVTGTWTNGYSVPELTCWGNEQGTTNCSPGGTPYVRPGGAINFSYSFTELYQARALADVLPYSGSGLMVTGFQYNWRSKNGNGWDDGRQDQLSAYVQLYSKSGQWLEAQSYNLNFVHDWTNFSWTGTFSKERRGDDLGTVLYGFAGKDNNYWLGPYGPEITNVSFSLRYQPDPCVVNPLHSTECPGFLKAIASPAVTSAEPVSQSMISAAMTSSSSSSSATPSLNVAMSVIKLNAQREQAVIDIALEQSTSVVSIENRGSNLNSSSTVQQVNQVRQLTNSFSVDTGQNTNEQDSGSTNVSSITIASSQSAATTTNLIRTNSRNQDSQTSNLEQDSSVMNSNTTQSVNLTVSVNSSPNVVRSTIQTQESQTSGQEQDSSVMNSNTTQSASLPLLVNPSLNVVRSTIRTQESQTSGQEQETNQPIIVSTVAVTVPVQLPQVSRPQQRSESQIKNDNTNEVTAIDQIPTVSATTNQTAQTAITLIQPTQNRISATNNQQEVDFNTQVNTALVKMPEIVNIQSETVNIVPAERPVSEPIVSAVPVINLLPPTVAPVINETAASPDSVRPPLVETVATDTQPNAIANALIDRTNPLNEILNGQQQITQSGPVFAGPSVKTATADNDLAGGVNISQIARVPAGFDVYQNLAIREIAFYQPREIYRGQRTVDNVRALRSLGQDARHQEMVDQQYRR